MNEFERHIEVLISGQAHAFSAGLTETLPLARPGVYTIWKSTEFLYVGIAGRALDLTKTYDKMRGIKDRLDSHWRGRRSGDQFAVYLFDRFVVPILSDQQRRQFQTGELNGDILTQRFIQTHLSYRFVETTSYREAMMIEKHLAQGKSRAGFPVLNPNKKAARSATASGG